MIVYDDNVKAITPEIGDVLDIPPDGKNPIIIALNRLHNKYADNGQRNSTFVVKQFNLFSGLNILDKSKYPEASILSDDLLTCGFERPNEHMGKSILSSKIYKLSQSQRFVKPVSFLRFRNVKVIFGKSGFCITKGDKFDPISTGLVHVKTIDGLANKHVEKGIITNDRFGAENICHFLFDMLGKAAVFYSNAYANQQFVLFHPKVLGEYQDSWLKSWPYPTEEYQNKEIVEFEELYVSRDVSTCFLDGFSHPANYASPSILNTLKAFRPHTQLEQQFDKIYVSRRDSDRRVLRNEEQLENSLTEMGFNCIKMTELTPEEQLQILSHASLIVGQHGAALTNIISCNAGTTIVELFNPERGTDAYEVLSRNLKLDYYTYNMDPASQYGAYIDVEDFCDFLFTLGHKLKKLDGTFCAF
jgi:hypothetical protein